MTDRPDWFTNEEFWEWTRPIMFSEDRFTAASDSIGDLKKLLGVIPPAAVLDLCCGPGRYTLPLAADGFEVTAVDRTPCLLAELELRRKRSGSDFEVVASDMRDFRRENAFDIALNLFTSFGYFDDPGDDRRVLENVLASLKPGGQLLIELIGREVLVRTYQKRDWVECDDIVVCEEREFHDSFTRLHNRWTVFRNGERRKWEFDLRLYSASDLQELLRSVGFTDTAAYGSVDGRPYDTTANRLLVVATK